MNTIWKYELELVDYQEIEVPESYEILTVQVQHYRPCMWVRLNPEMKTVKIPIYIYGTGDYLKANNLKYLSTFMRSNSSLVFHVFTETGF